MDTSNNNSQVSSQTQPPYKPGTIKSIKLINFMCHESFELSLGSRVNFVIGPNGSGKSALLTALVVALGGRAATTSRAKKMSDFILNGKSQAKISVVLHNYDKVMDKDRAFKPDDYGKHITVEKIISRDDATRLILKNDKDKKVSERKQELDEMVEHFGILIHNPICILNQEISKTFLHSKRPEDKFDLFLKATNLEQIEQDYLAAQLSHREWGECNSSRTVAFRLLDSEYNGCKEKVGFLENRAKLNDTHESLLREHIWAIARDHEKLSKQLDKKVKDITANIETTQKDIDKRLVKIKNNEEHIQLMESKLTSIREQVEETKKKNQDIRLKEIDAKKRKIDFEHKIKTHESKISSYSGDKRSLEKTISDLKQKFRDLNALDQDNEQRKLDIERLEGELKNDTAREKTLRLTTEQLSNSMVSTRQELSTANMRVSDLKNKISQTNGTITRLKNGQQNAIRKYGDFVTSILKEIDTAFEAGKFRKKPLGPLGYFLKLKSQEIAPSLEMCLGRNAHAFTCDSHQDMMVLMSIFKKLSISSREFKQPLVITRKYGAKHDISHLKAQHDKYRTFMDYLEIENEAIHNVLVDRCALETVLFIPDYYEAQRIMIQRPEHIPKNARRAYTKDCCEMYPNTHNSGYKSFANDPKRYGTLFSDNNAEQIKQAEHDIQRLESELRDSQRIASDIKLSLDTQRKDYNETVAVTKDLVDQMRQKEKDLLNLRSVITREPQELLNYETDLGDVIRSIDLEKLQLDKIMHEYEILKKELADLAQEKDSCTELQKRYETERQSIISIMDQTRNSIAKFQVDIKHFRIMIENRIKDKELESKNLDESLEKLARSRQNIPSDWVKPEEIRETEMIKDDIRKIDAQLRVELEEMRDPEELMQSLRKRMKEIEELVGLKESNMENFNRSTKTLEERKEGFCVLRSNTICAVSTTFSTIMRSMRMNGELQIHLDDVIHRGEVVKKARTLEIRIDTNYTPTQRASTVMNDNNNNNSQDASTSRRVSSSQPNFASIAPPRAKRPRRGANEENDPTNEKENGAKMTDARSLSGGERSFSTVAFVLALWYHCSSPFKLMDEIDVFMDMVTRRVSYNALIRFAQFTEDPGQFLFFSPLELPKIDDSGTSVRVFEMPSIVRKRPHSQMQAST